MKSTQQKKKREKQISLFKETKNKTNAPSPQKKNKRFFQNWQHFSKEHALLTKKKKTLSPLAQKSAKRLKDNKTNTMCCG